MIQILNLCRVAASFNKTMLQKTKCWAKTRQIFGFCRLRRLYTTKKMKLRKKQIALLIMAAILAVGYVLPEELIIPVEGASQSDWNEKSFWYEPWGKSGVHKGIDIFGPKGKRLNSSSQGVILYVGNISMGGNVVLILGPKWKLHYYAHLNSISVGSMSIVKTGDKIGEVGDSGNAKGKPPHLHYSIVSIVPRLWRIDGSTQGWKKMFFLNPGSEVTN